MAATLYRIILQVDNLDKAEEFYGKLLGDRGRPDYIYFSVDENTFFTGK